MGGDEWVWLLYSMTLTGRHDCEKNQRAKLITDLVEVTRGSVREVREGLRRWVKGEG